MTGQQDYDVQNLAEAASAYSRSHGNYRERVVALRALHDLALDAGLTDAEALGVAFFASISVEERWVVKLVRGDLPEDLAYWAARAEEDRYAMPDVPLTESEDAEEIPF